MDGTDNHHVPRNQPNSEKTHQWEPCLVQRGPESMAVAARDWRKDRHIDTGTEKPELDRLCALWWSSTNYTQHNTEPWWVYHRQHKRRGHVVSEGSVCSDQSAAANIQEEEAARWFHILWPIVHNPYTHTYVSMHTWPGERLCQFLMGLKPRTLTWRLMPNNTPSLRTSLVPYAFLFFYV